MGSWFRTLFIGLLVLAIPAKGIAAATMMFCGPHHHAAQPAVQVLNHAAQHAHHGHAAPELSELDGAGRAGQEAPGHADAHKCSACASCCSVAAIPGTRLAVAAVEVGATVFAVVEPSVEPFAASGPDRPPRVVLA
jgi:hypothetical protein